MFRLVISLLSLTAFVSSSPYPKAIGETFYELCADDYSNCIGAWSKSEAENFYDCIDSKNCTTVVAFEKNDDNMSYTFHTMTFNLSYVAMGFAEKQTMSSDSVVQCVKEGDSINVYLSVNKGYSNERLESKEGLTVIDTKLEDDHLYCKFQLDAGTKFGDLGFLSKSLNESYYLIAAAGSLETDSDGVVIGVGHHRGHVYTPDQIIFTAGSSAIAASIILLVISNIVYSLL